MPIPDWRMLGAFLAFVIGLFAVLGAFAMNSADRAGTMWWLLDLDREMNLTTFFSAALLGANGLLLFLWSRRSDAGGNWLLALGFFLAFMGIDELIKVHETLEKLSGVDWQLLYLPLALFAGPAWLFVLRRFDGLGRCLWIGGAVAWLCSQLLEAAQWVGDDVKAENYEILMLSEEPMEMAGSALFLLAIVRALQQGRLRN